MRELPGRGDLGGSNLGGLRRPTNPSELQGMRPGFPEKSPLIVPQASTGDLPPTGGDRPREHRDPVQPEIREHANPTSSRQAAEGPSRQLDEGFTQILRDVRRKANIRWIKDTPIESILDDREIVRYTPPGENEYFPQYPDIFEKAEEVLYDTELGIKAPVGEYGRGWARKTIGAEIKVQQAILNEEITAPDTVERVAEQHEDIIRAYTYNGFAESDLIRGVENTTDEGLHSTHMAANVLMYKRVPGYDDPQRLYDELIDHGVVSQLSLNIITNSLGEMDEGGYVLKDPIVVGEEGRLRLRPELVRFMNDHRHDLADTTGALNQLDRPGCPAGRNLPRERFSAVDYGAQVHADAIRGSRRQWKGFTRPRGKGTS